MIHYKISISRRGLSFLFFLLFAQSALAGPVNEQAAGKVALRFVSSFSSLRAESELRLVYTGGQHPQSPLRDDNSSLYYIYNVGTGGGFVIVSGDDKAYPVLGYADQGSFRTEQMPGNLSRWLDFYRQELLFAIERGEEAGTEISRQWAGLLSGEKQDIAAAVRLSTANWDQGGPYNALCPTDTNGKETVSGCVATAMGIAMKYHNWPEKGQGSHSYKTRTDSIAVSASFDVAYDWNNMLDTYVKNGEAQHWNTRQATAVATLLFHCGVAVEMDYKSSSSGAYSPNVVSALEKYFNYDKGMSLIYRELYTADEWAARIINELDNRRPVVYGGSTQDNAGHLFIVDGYATTGDYFHVNWGWSGIANGYYRLSSLEPSMQGIGGSTAGAGYSYIQEALTGMRVPQEGSCTNNELYFMDPSALDIRPRHFGLYTNVRRIVKDEPFKLYFTYIYDYGIRDFTGELALFLEDKHRNIKDTLYLFSTEKSLEEGYLPSGYVFYDNEGEPMLIESDVEEGDVIRMYYRPKGYEWRPLRGEPGAVTELPVYNEPVTSTSKAVKEEKIRTEITDGRFYIYFSQDAEVKQVKVYTLQGQEVAGQSYNTTVSPVVIDLNNMGHKTLIVTAHTSEGIISRKTALHK